MTDGDQYVWVVLIGFNCEGENLMGVFATEVEARNYEALLKDKRAGDYREVKQWRVGHGEEYP